MKTKVLLIGAALGLAVGSASADTVFSSNVVGYVNLDLVKGWNLVANPLDAGVNTLEALIQGVPDGTAVMKFQNGAFTALSGYDELFEAWEIDYSINPGEGFFINVPEPVTVTFVGEVKAGNHSVAIPAGWSMVGSPTPVAGTLDEIGFAAPVVEDGDSVMAWNPVAQSYSSVNGYDELFEAWEFDQTVAVGEAFFVNKASAATWTRTFEIK
ncbi:MAG: hypothetical protein ACOX2U_02310 [Limisphaerales bacterium]|jgi:hypothetical protein